MEEEKRNVAEEEAMNNLVKAVLKSEDVKTVFDMEEKLKKSFGKVIQNMLEAEMTENLGHDKYEYSKENKERSELSIYIRLVKKISILTSFFLL